VQLASLDDFKIKKVIDKGSFGKVFKVVNVLTGKEYAMKRIRKDVLVEKGQINNTLNEKDILLSSSHPFVLSMEYVFQNEYRIYFILDFIRGGNIYDHLYKLRRFPESQAKFVAV
jgi:serine/threonine protein kinase